jgi:hypothetical protein
MIPNSHITLYNQYVDSATRLPKFQRAEVFNCVWQGVNAIAKFKEQVPANTILILIPFSSGASYSEPKVWQDGRDGWTLQEGDIVVKGLVEDEIAGAFTLKDLYAAHQYVAQIASVAERGQGRFTKHWEVQAK